MPINQAERSATLDAFRAGLQDIRYPAEQIQEDYGYSNFLDIGQRETIDLAAFGSAVPSLRTCNIGVLVGGAMTAQSLVRVRALGAPLLFTYDVRQTLLSRWKMTKDGLPTQVEQRSSIEPGRLPAYFSDHRQDWEPEAFRQARTAIYQDNAPQLDFFDTGLLPTLEEQLQRKLSIQLKTIAANSRARLDARYGEGAFERHFSDFARLLFRLLAARLLSDRGDLAQNASAAQMLRLVEQKYHANAVSKPGTVDDYLRDDIWEALRSGLDLRNLSPETLAFVYENTLVDRDLRRRNGIHATPPYIADHLLRQLPIDRLPEQDRIVFEPFCGNAPFLLAAMRRLRELLPAGQTPEQVHQYLVERLLGMELLPFAAEIARYSLILGDYPNENSWQIAEGDAFKDAQFDEYLRRATIVLSNPPHETFPKGEKPLEAHNNRAAEALRRVLQIPPNLLGFVIPLSFVDGNQYKTLRRDLVKTYPNLTVTALPDNVFGNASHQTALIAAHRLDAQKRYFWAEVSGQDCQTTFPITGRPTIPIEEVSVLPTQKDGAPLLWQRPQRKMAPLWEVLATYSTLSSVATLHMGLQWRSVSGERFATNVRISKVEREGFAAGLHKVNADVEDYAFLGDVSYLDTHPQSFMKNLSLGWEQPKALVNAVRISRDIWRLLAIPDTEGFYATQNFIGIWPKDQENSQPVVAAEVLSAILNGPLANAYMQKNLLRKHNTLSVLEKMPLPSLSNNQISEITALVDAYKDLRWEYLDNPRPWTGKIAEWGRRALLKIDAAVLEAYALPSELEAELLSQFAGVNRGHLPFSFTGYDPAAWADAKAELADEREGRKIADQFNTLLRKRNLQGLTGEEQEEYDRLAEQRTVRRTRYRDALEAGK